MCRRDPGAALRADARGGDVSERTRLFSGPQAEWEASGRRLLRQGHLYLIETIHEPTCAIETGADTCSCSPNVDVYEVPNLEGTTWR